MNITRIIPSPPLCTDPLIVYCFTSHYSHPVIFCITRVNTDFYEHVYSTVPLPPNVAGTLCRNRIVAREGEQHEQCASRGQQSYCEFSMMAPRATRMWCATWITH